MENVNPLLMWLLEQAAGILWPVVVAYLVTRFPWIKGLIDAAAEASKQKAINDAADRGTYAAEQLKKTKGISSATAKGTAVNIVLDQVKRVDPKVAAQAVEASVAKMNQVAKPLSGSEKSTLDKLEAMTKVLEQKQDELSAHLKADY